MRKRAVAIIGELARIREFDDKVSLLKEAQARAVSHWLATTVGVLRTQRYGLRALFYRSFSAHRLVRTSLFRRVPIGRHIFFVARSASWHIPIVTLRIRGTCK